MEPSSELKHAREAMKSGNPIEARQILGDLVRREPDNAEAWEILFFVAEHPQEKLDCLKQVVRIQPGDEYAKKKLKKYKAGAEYREAKASYRLAALEHQEKQEKQANQGMINRWIREFVSGLQVMLEFIINGLKRISHGRKQRG